MPGGCPRVDDFMLSCQQNRCPIPEYRILDCYQGIPRFTASVEIVVYGTDYICGDGSQHSTKKAAKLAAANSGVQTLKAALEAETARRAREQEADASRPRITRSSKISDENWVGRLSGT